MGIKWWALKFFLYVLSFVCCFPLRRLTACVGKACVPLWFLILEMKSYECDLSFAPGCMLEDAPPWNTATFDSRTGFAKMNIGNFTPTRSHPDLLGISSRTRLVRSAPFTQCSSQPRNIHSIWKKITMEAFLTPKIHVVSLPFYLEKVEDQCIPLKSECSGKRLMPTQVNPLTQEVKSLPCKLIFFPFRTYYQGQGVWGSIYIEKSNALASVLRDFCLLRLFWPPILYLFDNMVAAHFKQLIYPQSLD